jgi:hypothetical protein
MTLSAVGVAWFSFVARIPLQAVNAKHVWDVIPLTLLAFAAIERCFGILAIVWLIFPGARVG